MVSKTHLPGWICFIVYFLGDGTYVKTQYEEGHDGNLLSQYNVLETSSLKLR